MMFVQAPRDIAEKQAEEDASEELKKTFTEPSQAPAEVLTDNQNSEEE
jgi:hypothetical protein